MAQGDQHPKAALFGTAAAMAGQQMVLEGRVASAEERLDRAALVVGEIGRRLKSVEGPIRPDAYITDE